jgi:hypothetical protein
LSRRSALEHLSRPFVKQGTYEGYRAAVCAFG